MTEKFTLSTLAIAFTLLAASSAQALDRATLQVAQAGPDEGEVREKAPAARQREGGDEPRRSRGDDGEGGERPARRERGDDEGGPPAKRKAPEGEEKPQRKERPARGDDDRGGERSAPAKKAEPPAKKEAAPAKDDAPAKAEPKAETPAQAEPEKKSAPEPKAGEPGRDGERKRSQDDKRKDRDGSRAPDAKKDSEPQAPETKAPETKAPEAKAPETKAPERKGAEPAEPETKASDDKRPSGAKGAAAPEVKDLKELKEERKERREDGGKRVVIEEPDKRIIVKEGGRTIIRHDETERFRRLPGTNVRREKRNGLDISISVRPGGIEIYTELDDRGRPLRRYRRGRDGREIILFDNRDYYRRHRDGSFIDAIVDLPPPRIAIPRERYIVDYDEASDVEIYETLSAPPVEELDRAYSLEEVRRSPTLRDRMRRIDLDAINFEFGSWEVTEDQYPALERIARAMKRVIEKNPEEMFLIEGHTDAVGSDEDNLSLSDRRAESVAIILTEEFGVTPENLTTQGYGEQHLKVDTEAAERQNRRVAVRRITPLLSRSN